MAKSKTESKTAKKMPEKENKKESKSMKPKLAGALVVVVVIGFIVLAMNASNIAKGAVEKVASNTLGVKVSIASMDISLQDRQVTVTGLMIGNPAGYKKPHAMTVDTIRIAAEDMAKDLLTFSEITVNGTDINIEVTESGTNLSDLRKNVDSKASQKKAASGEQPKVIIKTLSMDGAALNPSMTLAGGDLQSVTMPPIRISGIGQRSNGVLASEAIAQILEYVARVAMQTSAQSGYLQGMSPESLKEIQENFGISTGIMDQVKDLGDKVKSMFGN